MKLTLQANAVRKHVALFALIGAVLATALRMATEPLETHATGTTTTRGMLQEYTGGREKCEVFQVYGRSRCPLFGERCRGT